LTAGEDEYGYRKFPDSKRQKLESLIFKLVGSVLREARDRVIRAERWRLEEIERKKKEQERGKLAEQIAEEGKKIQELESWVKLGFGPNRHENSLWLSRETILHVLVW